ncbi:MAG: ImmA/IrrE family metallo-endopeptidase [Gemmatimonadaceae bacterium]
MHINQALAQSIRAHRERLQISQEQVGQHLRIPRSAVSEIEAGKRDVSAAELVALSRLFGESLERILGLVEHPAEEELVLLRAAAVPSPAQSQLNRWIHLCETYHQLEECVGEQRDADIRPVRRILSSYEQAHELADEERRRLGLGLTPAHQFLEVLEERAGMKVLFLELDDQVSGASVQSQRFGPAILINRRHSQGRRAFTLAHEYFHLLTRGRVARSRAPHALHLCEERAPGEAKDRAEQLADRFAGRLLLPPQHFVDRLLDARCEDGTINHVDLIGIARYFGVSVQAVFVQLAVLKVVPWAIAKAAYADPKLQDRILETSPGAPGPEPLRFRRLAVKAFTADCISRGRLAELLDVNVAEVDDQLARHGAGGSGGSVRATLPR